MTSITSSDSHGDRSPKESFWTRIAAELADAIGRGAYPPGERLPSEHALAEQFGVNRHTIRRSLADELLFGRLTDGGRLEVDWIADANDGKGDIKLDISPLPKKERGKSEPAEPEEAAAAD